MSSRIRVAALVALVASASCSDATLAPINDLSEPAAPMAVLNCTGSTAGIACSPTLSGALGDVIYGGQNSLIRITGVTGTVTYSGSTGTLSEDVSLQNLLGMPLSAAADWVTQDTTGVKIFMHVAPNNGVTFTSVDGTGAFTGSNQQYIKYAEIIAGNGGNQTKRTWTFVLPNAATTFTFQVYVYTKLPNEVGTIASNIPAHTFTALGGGSGTTQHMCAIRSGGSIYCWGNGQTFEFGIGAINNTATATGIYVSPYTKPVQALSPLTYTAVAAGASHTCGITSGSARCWGANFAGQLGDNSTTARSTAVTVSGLSNAAAISLGTNHTCVMTSAGSAVCWGGGTLGQIGDGGNTNKTSPQQVTGLTTGVTAISAGGLFSCAVVNGGAKCWGSRGSGRIGDSGATTGSQLTPADVTGLNSGSLVSDIAAGGGGGREFACAVVNGGVKCWGDNTANKLGSAAASPQTAPIDVTGLAAGSGAIQVVVGSDHACALLSGGTVKCWGANTVGQMGIGTTSASSGVVTVGGSLSGVDRVTASSNTTCAHIAASNTVKCWGYNNEGMIGDGITASPSGGRTTPASVILP